MSDELLFTLRANAYEHPYCGEAADEIEMLQGVIATLRAIIERQDKIKALETGGHKVVAINGEDVPI